VGGVRRKPPLDQAFGLSCELDLEELSAKVRKEFDPAQR
jgi:hypothetical protein